MIKNSLLLLAFAALCFVAAELSYRVYALGPSALRPAVMNSMTTILESGLIQPAAEPETYYELKPGLDTYFSGARFTTNSQGLADSEYSVAKPDGVFRIVVIGSSWSMATGVEHGENWHSVLERQLNETLDRPVEIINFAIEQYGLGEMLGSLRHRAMAYEPDLVLASLTSLTSWLVWEEHTEAMSIPAQRYPFWESLVLRQIAGIFGVTLYPQVMREDLGPDTETHRAQTVRAIEEFSAVAQAGGARLAVVWLGFRPLLGLHGQLVEETTGRLGVPLYLGYDPLVPYRNVGYGGTFHDVRFQVNRFNKHPNPEGHRLIAEYVRAGLAEDGLLPTN